MENLTFTNCLLAFLGVLMYVGYQLKKRKKQQRKKFSISFWFKDNIIDVILSVAATLAILLMADELCKYFNVLLPAEGETTHPAMKIIAFCAGIFNQSIIRWLMKAIKKKFNGKKS